MSYNSYKPRFRGRGSFAPRGGGGGYRGSRGGDSGGSWGSRGRGSSSFSSSGRGSGRFSGSSSWDKEVGMETTRSRYSGGDYGGGSSDRYSSRGDESYGRRYSRQGMSPDYGSRDHHRSSPDPSRKRMRSESSYQGSSSLRRTHEDNSYGGGNDYSHGYGSFGSSMDEKGGSGGYGDRPPRVYREEREHSRNDDYQYKKLMGPPSGPPRRSSSRGTFRGGRSFRGASRGADKYFGSRLKYGRVYSRGGERAAMKRMVDTSYAIRKKEYLQRLKLYRLKRLADRLKSVKTGKDDDEKKKSDKTNGNENDDDDIDEEEIEVEEEVETSVEEEEEDQEMEEDEDGEVAEKEAAENGIKKDDEELEEGETNEDGEVAASKKKSKKKTVRKLVKKIVKKKIKKEKPTVKRSKEVNEEDESKEGGNLQVTIKQDSENRAVNSDNKSPRQFVRLDCKHCNLRCFTFNEYSMHLQTTKHLVSMRKLALKLRQQLARMRIDQRREQLLLDAKHKDNPKLRTFFCSVCKLNHRSLKGEHMGSTRHQKMREFLMPYCRVCRLTFRSPMSYENHLCDLNHIKRAAKMEYVISQRKGNKEEGERNVDMDNFMILDSVGSPDESEEEGEKEEGQKEKASDAEKTDEKKKKKSEIKLGLEFCKVIEVTYCDLCNIYLPRNQPHEKVTAQHCRTRVHLERLVRVAKYKRRSHREHSKLKDGEKSGEGKSDTDKKEDADKSGCSEMDTSVSSSPTKKVKTEHSEDGDIDDKVWSDVDKDIGDLLREVEPENKSSDDEEEQGRYDRFKLSEKDKAAEDDKNRKSDSGEKSGDVEDDGDVKKVKSET